MKVTSAPHRLVWTLVDVGQSGVAVAERDALGTTARIAVWPREHLAAALGAVDARLERLDREASRFRSDSEISCVERAGGGIFFVSEGLAEAIAVALATARWTDGLVDPTVGGALIALGYDRDFATIDPAGDPTAVRPEAVPGWRSARLEGRLLHLPAGVRLDLGATAKGLGSDRAARAALDSMGHRGGVLVSLGGDIAIAGQPPRDGWPILVTDDHRSTDASTAQVVRLTAGAVADLVGGLPPVAARRSGTPPHRGPEDGAPGGRPLALRQRRRPQLRRGQRSVDSGHRRRRGRRRLAGVHGAPGAASSPTMAPSGIWAAGPSATGGGLT